MPTADPEFIYLSDILLPRDPQKANHAATKQYVDNQLTTVATLTHTHIVADVTGLGTAATVNTGTTEGEVPVLGVNGKLPTTVLPALAITNTYVVANQTGMLALTAEVGDIAIRTDLHKSFILAGDDPTSLSAWQELLSPTDAVTSVNGQTGAVSITLADLGAASAIHDHSDLYIPATILGMPGGVATLNNFGQIPFENLPTESVLTNSSELIPTSATVYSVVSTHTSATNAHSATSVPTASRIAMYSDEGNLSSGTPTTSSHVATKDYVDSTISARQYRTTFSGDGTNTEFDITHNLNSTEIEVQVYHVQQVPPLTNYTSYSDGIDAMPGSTDCIVTLPSGETLTVHMSADTSGSESWEWTGTATDTSLTGIYKTATITGTSSVGSSYPENRIVTLTGDGTKTTPVHVAFAPSSSNKITLLFATAPGTAESGDSFIVIVRK